MSRDKNDNIKYKNTKNVISICGNCFSCLDCCGTDLVCEGFHLTHLQLAMARLGNAGTDR